MSYPQLALAFLAAAVVVGLALPLVRRPRRWPRWTAVGVTILALVVLTAVFDSVMIAAGLFHYAPETLAGPHIGLAPIEDFAYPLATAALLPALWEVLRRRRTAGHDDGERAGPAAAGSVVREPAPRDDESR